jgi:uncharacterized protein YqcC (DUF446 family)
VVMDAARIQIAERLIDLEAGLRQLGLWSEEIPAPEALASEQPFAMDTLSLQQWLQFIFLPTLYQLIESGGTLPSACAIAPMAEETLGKLGLPTQELLATLRDLDRLISETQ